MGRPYYSGGLRHVFAAHRCACGRRVTRGATGWRGWPL